MTVLIEIAEILTNAVAGLRFSTPVTYVYNPLRYAWPAHREYLARYGTAPKEVVLLGMNPGPFGMAQTGIPFGTVAPVRDWLGITAEITPPAVMHPRRPIQGFACPRQEISGLRLWGWAQERAGTPEQFFARFWVANYCPLAFLEASGRNFTPDRLPAHDRAALFRDCDHALRATIAELRPRWVIGIGRFAAQRAAESLAGHDLVIATVTHPSPANPRAHHGWARIMDNCLNELGITPPGGD